MRERATRPATIRTLFAVFLDAVTFIRVHGEFVLMPLSVFDRAHDNVTANDMIGDLQGDRFTSKQVETPQTVLHVTMNVSQEGPPSVDVGL